MYVTESLVPRCPLITGGVIIRCFYQASHSQVTKCFIIPPSGERASGHTVSVAWGVSGIPAGGPAGPPKPGDRAGRRWGGEQSPRGSPLGDRHCWPLLSGARSAAQAPPGWTDLSERCDQLTTDPHARCFFARSLPGAGPGAGMEAHWCQGESGGLCRPGRPRPGFLQARLARPPGGQVKAQTRGDWTGTWSTAEPRPGPACRARGL